MNATFLTLDEVAAILRISNSTVYKLIHNLNLPALKVGKQWRVKTDHFEIWLNRHIINNCN